VRINGLPCDICGGAIMHASNCKSEPAEFARLTDIELDAAIGATQSRIGLEAARLNRLRDEKVRRNADLDPTHVGTTGQRISDVPKELR
jgi:hypothetical protein